MEALRVRTPVHTVYAEYTIDAMDHLGALETVYALDTLDTLETVYYINTWKLYES